ncbi:hypothetical protein MBAV_004172 [Candidatus Magnetobacterium bavaricum]|uniref:Uncharacterized protein n=1 Tax=Candidatus Magnetobacterium bavaricum TaxID=29290 RepID=A0A0F3GNS2_9BACT|nr:hypothetical protein MBAV_004172 [Candidatus Magnetobacterium bavaricum]
MTPCYDRENYKWHDRKNYKQRFQKCFDGNHRLSFICLHDKKEITYLAHWIEECIKDKQTVVKVVYYSKAKASRKHVILKYIADKLGGRDKFPKYYNEDDTLSKPKKSQITLNNKLVNYFSAGNDIDYEKIEQKVDPKITINDATYVEKSIDRKREDAIDSLMEKFVIDITEIVKTEQKILFLFIFGKGGLSAFDEDFQDWFLTDFCDKMKSISGIKICVLNESSYDDSITLVSDLYFDIPAKLEYSEMLEAANEHFKGFSIDTTSFCRDAITDNKNSYCDFARELSVAIENTNEGVS